MRRFLSALRIRLILLALVLLSMFFALPAAAQDAADVASPPGWLQWVAIVVTALLGVLAAVGPQLAKLTSTTVDDDVVAWIGKNRATIEDQIKKVSAWADPTSPSVPPSPTNPEGKA